jgi:hypothetical protein
MVTRTPQETLRTLLNRELTNALDDLNRAKWSFKDVKDLKTKYGQSGQTHQEILDQYQDAVDNLNNGQVWLVEGR